MASVWVSLFNSPNLPLLNLSSDVIFMSSMLILLFIYILSEDKTFSLSISSFCREFINSSKLSC